jgi:hypothetical protein
MTTTNATASDLHALAELVTAHPELHSEVTAAVAELHIVLSYSDTQTPTGLAKILLAAGGRMLDEHERVHRSREDDPSFAGVEVLLPAQAITLTIEKMRPGGPIRPTVAPDGPVTFARQNDEATLLRATLGNLVDELEDLFRAPDHNAYSRARAALAHRLHEVKQVAR